MVYDDDDHYYINNKKTQLLLHISRQPKKVEVALLRRFYIYMNWSTCSFEFM